MAFSGSADHAGDSRRQRSSDSRLHGQGAPGFRSREKNDRGSGAQTERERREEATRRRTLGPRRELGRSAYVVGVAADHQHRRLGWRLYRAGRKNGSSRKSGRQDGFASRAGYDRQRSLGGGEGAP